MIQEVHAHQASRPHLQVSPSCWSCVEGAENRCPYGAAASVPTASPVQLSNVLNLLLDAQDWKSFSSPLEFAEFMDQERTFKRPECV
jgi:hypothetical protein